MATLPEITGSVALYQLVGRVGRWAGRTSQQDFRDRRPRQILQLHQRRVGEHRSRRRTLCAAFHQNGNFDLAIGVIGVAFAVASVERWTYPRHLVDALHHLRRREIGGQQFPLGVDIGADVVRDARIITA